MTDEEYLAAFVAADDGPATAYDTPLAPDEEAQFQAWKARFAPDDSGGDYDLRGAFKAGVTPDPQTGHWPDTFKKPNHPTFSVESKYATGKDAAKAGHWEGEKFIPSDHQADAAYLDDFVSRHDAELAAAKETGAQRLTKLLASPEMYPDIRNAGEARAKHEAEGGPEPVSKMENVEATLLGAAKTMFPAAAGIATATGFGPIGLLASLPVGYGAAKAQSAALEAWHPGAQKEIAQVAEEHPIGDFVGELLPTLAAMRPGRPQSLKVAGLGAALGAGMSAIGSVMEGEAPSLYGTGLSALLGAFLKPHGFMHGPTPKGRGTPGTGREPGWQAVGRSTQAPDVADPNLAKGPFVVPPEAPYEPTVKDGRPVPPKAGTKPPTQPRGSQGPSRAAPVQATPSQRAKPSPEEVSSMMLDLSERLKANPPEPLPGSPEYKAAHPAADPVAEATDRIAELPKPQSSVVPPLVPAEALAQAAALARGEPLAPNPNRPAVTRRFNRGRNDPVKVTFPDEWHAVLYDQVSRIRNSMNAGREGGKAPDIGYFNSVLEQIGITKQEAYAYADNVRAQAKAQPKRAPSEDIGLEIKAPFAKAQDEAGRMLSGASEAKASSRVMSDAEAGDVFADVHGLATSEAEAEAVARQKRHLDLQDAYRAMEEEFGRPLSTPEANQLDWLEAQAHADGEPEPAASAVAMAKALPPPPGPETMPVAQAMAEGVSPEEYAGSVKVAFAEGRPIHPEAAAAVPEVQNAREVMAQLPEFSPEDIAIAQAEAEAVRAEARGESFQPEPWGFKGEPIPVAGTLKPETAPRTRQDAPGAAGRTEKGPWHGEARPALPGGVPGYATARAGYEPVRQSWAKADEMVRAVGGDPELLRGGTAEQALAHAYKATEMQTAVVKAAAHVNAEPTFENATALKAALRGLDAAMVPLRSGQTERAQALAIARAYKGVAEHGEQMLSIADVGDRIGREQGRTARPTAGNFRTGGGPRSRKGGGAHARGGQPAAPRRYANKTAAETEELRYWANVSKTILSMKSPAEIAMLGRTKLDPKQMTRGERIGAGTWNLMINGMLSGPRTILAAADVANLVLEPLDTAMSVPAGYLRRGVATVGGKIIPGEFGKTVGSYAKGDRVYLREAAAQVQGLVGSTWESILRARTRFRIEPADNPYVESSFSSEPAIRGKLGKASRIPQRLVGLMNDIPAHMQYRGKEIALAHRQAITEGLTGDAYKQRVAYLQANSETVSTGQTRHGMTRGTIGQQARKTAAEASWGDRNAIAELVGRAKAASTVKGFPLLGPFAPFVTVAMNMKANVISRQPLPVGFALPSVRKEFSAGGASADRVIGRLMSGAGLMGLFVYLKKKGNLTGDRPYPLGAQGAEQAAKDTAGWAPNALHFGDTYVSLRSIPVFGDFAQLASDFVDNHDKYSEDGAMEFAGATAYSAGKWLENRTFIETTASVLELVDADPERRKYAAKQLALSMATMPVPRLLSSIAQALDPNLRRAETISEAYKKTLPVVRESLPSYMDLYGEPVKVGYPGVVGAVERLASPFPRTPASNDPVRSELARLKMRLRRPQRTIDGYTMTGPEYEEYQEKLGHAAHDTVSGDVRANWAWHQLPDNKQRVKIEKAFEDASELMRSEWRKAHPAETKAWEAKKKREREGYYE